MRVRCDAAALSFRSQEESEGEDAVRIVSRRSVESDGELRESLIVLMCCRCCRSTAEQRVRSLS